MYCYVIDPRVIHPSFRHAWTITKLFTGWHYRQEGALGHSRHSGSILFHFFHTANSASNTLGLRNTIVTTV